MPPLNSVSARLLNQEASSISQGMTCAHEMNETFQGLSYEICGE